MIRENDLLCQIERIEDILSSLKQDFDHELVHSDARLFKLHQALAKANLGALHKVDE